MAKSIREIFEFDKEIEQKEKETKQQTKAMDIKNLMNNTKWTIEQAMDALGVPSDQRSMYAKLVKGI